MPQVEVTAAEPNSPIAKTLLADFDQLMQKIRRRAYELFEKRGHKHGSDLEDWFRAEEELLFPVKIQTKQEPGGYQVRVSVPGFPANSLKVYTVDNNLVLRGTVSEKSDKGQVSSEQNQTIFYQWPLPPYAQTDNIKAEYKDETLTIRIPVDTSKPIQAQTPESKNESQAGAAAA